MLLALFGGEALPAGELARAADLSAAATSLHLAKLCAGGLIAVRKEGRHRYYRLANGDVAHALEVLGLIATAPPKARTFTAEQTALRAARTCYDHLAGFSAVALADSLAKQRLLAVIDEVSYGVTPRGKRWFTEHLAIDVAELARGAAHTGVRGAPRAVVMKVRILGSIHSSSIGGSPPRRARSRAHDPRQAYLRSAGAQTTAYRREFGAKVRRGRR